MHIMSNDQNMTGESSPSMAWKVPIDSPRPLKVICIGAGMSGILAGIRFPQKIGNLDFTIYEKNSEIGGTWLENRYVLLIYYVNCQEIPQRNGLTFHFRYPGIACGMLFLFS